MKKCPSEAPRGTWQLAKLSRALVLLEGFSNAGAGGQLKHTKAALGQNVSGHLYYSVASKADMSMKTAISMSEAQDAYAGQLVREGRLRGVSPSFSKVSSCCAKKARPRPDSGAF